MRRQDGGSVRGGGLGMDRASAGTSGEMASEGVAATSSGAARERKQDRRAPRRATAGSIATTVFESGLGLVPLVGELLGLFGGGDAAPAPLEKYAMPDPIDFEGVDTGSGMSAADFDQMGMPRLDAADAGGHRRAAGQRRRRDGERRFERAGPRAARRGRRSR